STMRLTRSAANAALPGGRVLSRRRPSTPSSMKRSCQRQTTGLDSPDRRMTSSIAAAVGGRQDNAGARRVLLQAVAISDDPIKAAPIFQRDFNNDPCSHTQSMRQITAFGNPPNASFH